MTGLPLLLPAAGAAAGLGLWLAYDTLAPARPGLAAALADPPRRPPPSAVPPSGLVDSADVGWTARASRPLAALLARVGARIPGRIMRDLPICGRTPERHLAEKATTALVGLFLPPLLALALPTAGAGRLPAAVWAGGAVLLAVAGFLAPDAGVAGEAAQRRRDARHALSAFLDLTVIGLAGGAGVEQALAQAAGTGDTPTIAALRRALEEAVVRREPLWASLDRLGRTLGVGELRELAASLSLAGTEGAKIRASLAAKAAALRVRLLADIETQAQSATERMSLPLVVMFAGFLVFIAYPALAQVITGL